MNAFLSLQTDNHLFWKNHLDHMWNVLCS